MKKEDLNKLDFEYAKAIAKYLIERCENDNYLADAITKCKDKDLKGCITYIKGEAKKKAQDGCAILTDDEVYQMAVHYYLEGGLKPTVEEDLEEEELEETDSPEMAKPVVAKPKKKNEKKEEAKQEIKKQLTLFDFM